MSIKLASWNVNSIKMRQNHVINWLDDCRADVLFLQELKTETFPEDAFRDTDYAILAKGQKGRNGVAILLKKTLFEKTELVADTLEGDSDDQEARYQEIKLNTLTLINIYLPNGNPVNTEKYEYKIKWMERLFKRMKALRLQSVPFLIGGDFNVIPEDKDCHDPKAWDGDALFRHETRKAFRKMTYLGLYDAYRIKDNRPGAFTFWDYQGGAWQKDNGIRIDHFLLSPEMADAVISCRIDKDPRNLEKPSDHTPIILEVDRMFF